MTFTLGRGNEIIKLAVESLLPLLIGKEIREVREVDSQVSLRIHLDQIGLFQLRNDLSLLEPNPIHSYFLNKLHYKMLLK